jgi:hypothetical protein
LVSPRPFVLHPPLTYTLPLTTHGSIPRRHSREELVCVEYGAPVRVFFIRDDTLSLPSDARAKPTEAPSSRPPPYTAYHWTRYLERVKPDVLILNYGGHFYNTTKYRAKTDQLVSYLKAHLPTHTHLVYRTTYVGHPSCWEHKGPVTDPSWKLNVTGK